MSQIIVITHRFGYDEGTISVVDYPSEAAALRAMQRDLAQVKPGHSNPETVQHVFFVEDWETGITLEQARQFFSAAIDVHGGSFVLDSLYRGNNVTVGGLELKHLDYTHNPRSRANAVVFEFMGKIFRWTGTEYDSWTGRRWQPGDTVEFVTQEAIPQPDKTRWVVSS